MKMYIEPISKEALDTYLAITDLTQSPQPHAIKMAYEKLVQYIRSTHPQSDVRVYRKDPVVTVEDNYDNLLIAADHISRSSTYTHYVDQTHMLRTHTSAHLPGILRELAGQDHWEDVVILLPGLAYRRDVSDKKHVSEVHMLEMWRVVKNAARQPIVKDDLLARAGLDPKTHSGWALGMGLDRLVMTLKGIPDIRYLRSTNPRIAKQMANLELYQEVSNQPAIKRDLSYSVPQAYVEEDMSDDIREALGDKLEALESVEVLSETPYAELPEKIRERLGCQPLQKNVLVRITLRHLERSITNEEANRMYEQMYKKINKGTGGYL